MHILTEISQESIANYNHSFIAVYKKDMSERCLLGEDRPRNAHLHQILYALWLEENRAAIFS